MARRSASVSSAQCVEAPIEMPVWSLGIVCLPVTQNPPRKSLMPWCNVQRGWRNPQVLLSPRMPKAKWDHLSLRQGMETVTGMAPPRGTGVGWRRLPHLFLPNYGSSTSRGSASPTQKADYGRVEEVARTYPMRSVNRKQFLTLLTGVPSRIARSLLPERGA